MDRVIADMPRNEREDWLDVAKGLGILLVVFAHVAEGPASRFIFLFHMPLFFMLSGYLMKPGPLAHFAANRTLALLLPYGCYLLLIGFPELMHGIRHYGLQYAYGGRKLSGKLGVFWFVTCLFLAQVCFATLIRWKAHALRPALVIVVAVIGAAAYATAPLDLPWNAGLVPAAVVLLWAGHALKQTGFRPVVCLIAGGVSLSAVVLAPDLLSLERWPDMAFNMKPGNLGFPVYGLALGASLSVLLMLLARSALKVRWLSTAFVSLGTASLTIMFLHQFVHFTAARFTTSVWAQVALAIVFPYCVHLVCSRYRPLRIALLGTYRIQAKQASSIKQPSPDEVRVHISSQARDISEGRT